MEKSLILFQSGKEFFSHEGKWLHPLLALETFLRENPLPKDELVLQDKIIGKAAALIIVYLEIKTVKAGILSEPGKVVFEEYAVSYTYNDLVPLIECQTEKLLSGESDPQKAYEFIRNRVKS